MKKTKTSTKRTGDKTNLIKLSQESIDSTKDKEKIKRERVKEIITNGIGLEPKPVLDDKANKIQIVNALNYYSAVKSHKDSCEYLKEYFKRNQLTDVNKKLSKINSQYIGNRGFVIRMIDNGFQFEPDNKTKINETISFINDFVITEEEVTELEKTKSVNQLMVDPVLDQLDILIDNTKLHIQLTDCQPKDYKKCLDVINSIMVDIEEPIYLIDESGKKEKEQHYLKETIKRIKDLHNYVSTAYQQVKKVIVRKKKKIDPFKMVADLKYLIKDERFNSIKPIDIIGKKKLYIFDTKTRRLKCLISNIDLGFHVKGTTILNVDMEKSMEKLIASKDIAALSSCTNVTCVNKYFKAINGLMKSLSHCRTNDTTIILAAS